MSSRKPLSPEGRNVAILGVGVLGRRIACSWVAAGYNVIMRDIQDKDFGAALHYIETNVDEFRSILKPDSDSRPGKYDATTDLETAVKNAWFVIEAVPEKLQLKIDVLGDLDKLAPPDCIFGTNSSSYKSSLMVEKIDPSRRWRFCNTHYQMPPAATAVELMTCGETDESVFDCLMEHLNRVGMMPVKVRKESTGLILNRIWAALKREVLMVIGEGVGKPEEIDNLFMAMFSTKSAPCAMMDAIGLDTVAFIEDNYIQERGLPGTYTVEPLRRDYIDQGKLGAKSGKGGFYPPGYTTKPAGEDKIHHDNLAAPTLYVLDVGLGANVPLGPGMMSSGSVLIGSPDGRPFKTLVSTAITPDGLDIHLPSGRIFWTSMGNPSANDGAISSAKLDGSDIAVVLDNKTVHTPKQMVIDQTNEKLYFCDREGLKVGRCNLDGSQHETLVQTGDWHDPAQKDDVMRWCVGVTVDPSAGKFYWTQKGPSKGGKGRIFRASMTIPSGETPSNRSDIELLFDNLPEAIDLELDVDEQILYWTDRGEYPVGNTLNRAFIGLDPSKAELKKRAIVARHFHEAIGLKLDTINKHIYVADLGGSVYRTDLDGSNKKRIYDTERCFTGIGLTHVG